MQVAMKHASAELTKTPTDGKGTFDFVVHAFEIDKDNERVKSFTGLPTELFIGYQHVNNLTAGIKDPGAFIGKATVRSDPVGLRGSGVLDLKNPMGMAVYERMLLPADDPLALNELSIGFAFDANATTHGPKGELVIPEAQLAELSVVHVGSQRTEVMNLKSAAAKAALDDSAWDKNQAMGQCNSAADYRSICAGEHSVGTPDERRHWALPHHYLGKPANAAGVAAARSRFDQTQDLTNSAEARRHLFEIHQLPSDSARAKFGSESLDLVESIVVSMKAGRVISSANLAKLRAAQEVINELLAFGESEIAAPEQKTKANGEEPQANPEERGPDADLRRQLAAFIA